MTLRREAVDMDTLVKETAASFEASAAEAGVTLSVDVDGALPQISADPSRLQSVVSNLVSNAIRHTPRGGAVRVSIELSGESLEVSVIDTGEGIPPDLLPHVFERFVKGSASSGSGLGLAIARDLVVAHGGKIE